MKQMHTAEKHKMDHGPCRHFEGVLLKGSKKNHSRTPVSILNWVEKAKRVDKGYFHQLHPPLSKQDAICCYICLVQTVSVTIYTDLPFLLLR